MDWFPVLINFEISFLNFVIFKSATLETSLSDNGSIRSILAV